MTDDPHPAVEAEGTSTGGRAEVRELERQLAEARAQVRDAEARAAENLDRWQRAQADLANYRRRTQFEREQEQKYAVTPLLADALRVADGFDRAWKSLPASLHALSWLDGVLMLDRQFRATLERHGARQIEAIGARFDPRLHEAVASEPGEGHDHVVETYQEGYFLHDRLLRAALVRVGPAPAAGAEGTRDVASHDDHTGHTDDVGA